MYELINDDGDIVHITSSWAVAQIFLTGRLFGAVAVIDYS